MEDLFLLNCKAITREKSLQLTFQDPLKLKLKHGGDGDGGDEISSCR